MRTHGCWRQTLQVKPAQPAEGPRQGPAVGPQAGFLAKAMLCHKAWVGDALEGIEVQGKGDHAEHKGSKPSVPQMNRRRRRRGSVHRAATARAARRDRGVLRILDEQLGRNPVIDAATASLLDQHGAVKADVVPDLA